MTPTVTEALPVLCLVMVGCFLKKIKWHALAIEGLDIKFGAASISFSIIVGVNTTPLLLAIFYVLIGIQKICSG